MSTLDEVVKVIRETNQAEAARKKAADDLAIANENKKFDELKEALKKTSDENKRSQIQANIALIEETRAARKSDEDNRSDAKKNLDDNRQGLEVLRKQIEDNGGKAEANLQFQKAANQVRREELALQKQSATNPSERKEIAKEQRKAQFDAVRLAFAPVISPLQSVVGAIKGIAGIQTGIPGLTIGRLALLAFIPAVIAFLNSDTWKEIKQSLLEIDFSSLSGVVQGFKDTFIGEGVGGRLTVIAAITAATALLAPSLLFKTLEVGLKAFVSAISFVGSRLGLRARSLRTLTTVGALAGTTDLLAGGDQRLKKENEKAIKEQNKNKTKNTLKSSTKGVPVTRGLVGAARIAGPVALAFGAIIASVDGVTAGIEEFKESGEIGKAVQKGFARFTDTLTLGLVSEETTNKLISDFQQTFRPSTDQRIEQLERDLAFQRKRLEEGSKFTTLGENLPFLGTTPEGVRKMGTQLEREKLIKNFEAELKMLRERHSGGMMMAGETAILKGGEMLVSAQSPTQVFAERRAESLAVQAMTGGGGGEGGGTMFLNTGSNVQNVNKQTIVTPIVDQDPVIRQVSRSIMA